MEVGNVFYMEDKKTKAIIRKLYSKQSSIIEGKNNKVHFIKLAENDELKQGKVQMIDWSLFF